MTITAFWYVTPCNLTEVDRRFRGTYHLHKQGPGNEGSKNLSNISQHLPDCMLQYPNCFQY